MRIQTARRHDTATATSSTSAATATGCAPIRTYGEPPEHRRSRKPLPREPRDCHASGLKRRRPGAGLWSLRSRRPPQDPIKATERAQAGPRLPSPESAQFSVARNAQFSSAIDSGRGNRHQDLRRDVDCRSIPAWAGKPHQGVFQRSGIQVPPRVGGETPRPTPAAGRRWGPSPRGRGNLGKLRNENVEIRSIPAWAGKPSEASRGDIRKEVHPRVGGETSNRQDTPLIARGPSPRGRGNLIRHSRELCLAGSIPAWAAHAARKVSQNADRFLTHPGSSEGLYRRRRQTGRGCGGGETITGRTPPRVIEGPSPRGRGNPKSARAVASRVWSIPAWAGKPEEDYDGDGVIEVHPRVGGETVRLA